MSNTDTVNVTLFSRTFSLKTSPENAPKLTQLADYLHSKMKQISRATGNKAFEGLVVAAALNILAECDEKLQQTRAQRGTADASPTAIPNDLDEALARYNTLITSSLETKT